MSGHLLSVPQACARLGIRRAKLYLMFKDDTNPIPSVTIGTRRLIRESDLDQWIAGLETSTKAA